MAVFVKPLHFSYNRAIYELLLILLFCRISAMKNSAMAVCVKPLHNNRAIYESILILLFCKIPTMAVCVKTLHNSYNRAIYESLLIILFCRTSAMKNSAMAVCVKPLHFSYNRALWLIEFIELYKILGTQPCSSQ